MAPRRHSRTLDFAVTHLAQPLLAWRRGLAWRRYAKGYARRYEASREELAATSLDDVRALLEHAHDTVPFWREAMRAAGVERADLGEPAALTALPPLTRHVALEHTDDLLSSAYPREALVQMRTGGTTGDPLPLFHDAASAHRKAALSVVLRDLLGWPVGARAAYLWGAIQDLPDAQRSRLRRLKEDFILEHVERTLLMPANRISPEDFVAHRKSLLSFRPDVLQGYPTATDQLARWLLTRGETLAIPLVLLTAEPVFADQRTRIAQALGANVLSFYGSRENGWIASECPTEHRLHINTVGVHLERTEDGRLLVTDLLNKGMPLIRYDIGDRGVLAEAPCACGDPRPVLERLEGRAHDIFVLPSGRLVPGVVADVRGLHVDRHGVSDAQFVQNELAAMDIYWVAGPGCDEGALERFRSMVDEYFDGELELRMHQVERIEPEANGKVRGCICRVPLP